MEPAPLFTTRRPSLATTARLRYMKHMTISSDNSEYSQPSGQRSGMQRAKGQPSGAQRSGAQAKAGLAVSWFGVPLAEQPTEVSRERERAERDAAGRRPPCQCRGGSVHRNERPTAGVRPPALGSGRASFSPLSQVDRVAEWRSERKVPKLLAALRRALDESDGMQEGGLARDPAIPLRLAPPLPSITAQRSTRGRKGDRTA